MVSPQKLTDLFLIHLNSSWDLAKTAVNRLKDNSQNFTYYVQTLLYNAKVCFNGITVNKTVSAQLHIFNHCIDYNLILL